MGLGQQRAFTWRRVRIAFDFTRLSNDWSWPRPASQWGLTRKRWDEYRRLFKTFGLTGRLYRSSAKNQVLFVSSLMIAGDFSIAAQSRAIFTAGSGIHWTATPIRLARSTRYHLKELSIARDRLPTTGMFFKNTKQLVQKDATGYLRNEA